MDTDKSSGETLSSSNVGQFFDSLSDDYTSVIERCFPRYREMLWALLDYLPPNWQPDSILELGCGTGNLSTLLASKFPQASIRMIDLSAESLDECRGRLGDDNRFAYDEVDFRNLEFADESFDLIAASISVHHLTSDEKQALFGQIISWLKPGGVFAYVDQHAGATVDLYMRHIAHWKTLAIDAGSTADEWEMWMQHQREHDHHDTLADQMEWLFAAGFEVVDCPWRFLLWTVLQARK